MVTLSVFSMALLISTAMPASPGSGEQTGVTGVYVGSRADQVELVQLVQTPDGRIAGRLEVETLNADGQIDDQSVTIEGSTDHNQITFAPKSLLMPGSLMSETGFVDGELLDLSGAGGHRVLKRGDAYAFEAAATGLKARSAQIIAEQQANGAQTNAAALNKMIAELGSAYAPTMKRLSEIEGQYAQLYEIEQNYRRKGAFLEHLQGSVMTGQRLTMKGEDTQWTIDGLHGDVGAMRTDISGKIDAARDKVASFKVLCGPRGNARLMTVCSALPDEAGHLDHLAGDFTAAFDQAEASYKAKPEYIPPGRRFLNNLVGSLQH